MSGRQIRGFQPSYSSFLASTYHSLMELWMNGDIMDFWQGIRGFATFLPVEIKDKVAPQIEAVRKELYRKLNNIQRIDFYIAGVASSKTTKNVLNRHSLPILDQIMRLLDERGYLEKGGRYLKQEDFQKLKEETG